jgi:hypothetical protein
MNKKHYLTVILILFLFSIAFSASSEKIDKGSIEIIIKDDSVTVSLKDYNGILETITFNKSELSVEKVPDKEPDLSRLYIKNELIIDGDRIVIDGVEFSSEEIENLFFSGKIHRGISVKAKILNDDYELCRKKVVNVEKHGEDDLFSFNELIINADEVIYGDVVSLVGNVKVYGEVFGDIVSVFGDVEMYDGSFAGGDVIAPFGRVLTFGDLEIKGKLLPKEKLHEGASKTDFDMSARFNRVEGFTLLSGIHYSEANHELPDIDINVGYAFALKRWNYDLGFRQQFGDEWAFYFGGNLYREATTPDLWRFSQSENTIAGLFFKEDYHDFYHRKGATAYTGQQLGEYSSLQIEYTAQTNDILEKRTNKAIFGGKKHFRENFSTVLYDSVALMSIKGDLRLVGLRFRWDSRNDDIWPNSGQHMELVWETAGDGIIGDIGGDFSYDIVEASVSHYQPLTPRQHLGLRVRGGYSDQQLPLDRWFFLGGVGSLRGYDYKEFCGNRYVFSNVDYYWEFSDDFIISLFADIGKAGFGEYEFKESDYKSDIGLGFIIGDAIRLDIAQRLDDVGKSPVVMARTVMSF